MREIKFSILLQNQETGRIIERIYDYASIYNGEAQRQNNSLLRYVIFAKRQWTGLKDKNSKEIFEGDIVKYIDYDRKEYICEVVWDDYDFNYGWHFYPKGKNYFWETDGLSNPWEKTEVIGNVYENPELVKA